MNKILTILKKVVLGTDEDDDGKKVNKRWASVDHVWPGRAKKRIKNCVYANRRRELNRQIEAVSAFQFQFQFAMKWSHRNEYLPLSGATCSNELRWLAESSSAVFRGSRWLIGLSASCDKDAEPEDEDDGADVPDSGDRWLLGFGASLDGFSETIDRRRRSEFMFSRLLSNRSRRNSSCWEELALEKSCSIWKQFELVMHN